MRTHSFVFFAGLTLTVACSSPTDSKVVHRVQLSIAKASYVSGETVHVDVHNVSSDQLIFPGGFCPAVLQEFRDGAWSTPLTDGACPLSLQLVGPHSHTPFEWRLRDGLQGVYRLLLPSPAPVDGQSEPPLTTVEFTVNSNAY
jgi:hypothetical protein